MSSATLPVVEGDAALAETSLAARRLTVERSEWLGHVTGPKGARSRQLPMTQRLTAALKTTRHLRSDRVLCLPDGAPITRDGVIKAPLSSHEQDRVGRWLLHELTEDAQWTRELETSQDPLSKLAAEARAERTAGRVADVDPERL